VKEREDPAKFPPHRGKKWVVREDIKERNETSIRATSWNSTQKDHSSHGYQEGRATYARKGKDTSELEERRKYQDQHASKIGGNARRKESRRDCKKGKGEEVEEAGTRTSYQTEERIRRFI